MNKKEIAKQIMGERKPIKIKRKRKPMSDEQRIAAAERLKKARDQRAEKNGPAKNKMYHSSVYDNKLIDLKELVRWLKNAKDQASSYKQSVKLGSGDHKQRAHNTLMFNMWDGYSQDIQWYLRTGDWISDYFGEHMGAKTNWTIVAPGKSTELAKGERWTIDDIKIIDDNPITIKRKTKRKINETE